MLPDGCYECIMCGVPVYLDTLCTFCKNERVRQNAVAKAIKAYINHCAFLRTEPSVGGINNEIMPLGFMLTYYYPEEHDF